MGKEEKTKVSLKKKVGQEEAITILEDILKGFKAGNMIIQNGEESATLIPSDKINMEIKAKTNKRKNKLSIKLSWKDLPCEAEDFSITESGEKIDPEPEKTGAETKDAEPDYGKAVVIKKASK
ncbi:amphi-Trp domain-containing protein [Maridesulfovibrio sp.]|uniref:amphi-Trp domain-containing protein n=1 Tax=Maridesulfovibrio sp. TaxID=2795000 RepID=UPI002AA9611B|nr:amphi-Trp domain-containing protein [Maridesulfovibrio sp.]